MSGGTPGRGRSNAKRREVSTELTTLPCYSKTPIATNSGHMKFKGIRISPHPPPKSLRQNPGRLVTGGPVFPVTGQRRARSAQTRG